MLALIIPWLKGVMSSQHESQYHVTWLNLPYKHGNLA